MTRRQLIHSLMAVVMLLTATSCKDGLDNWWNGDAPDMQGEAISFTSQLPAVQTSATTRATVDTKLLEAYKVVNNYYDFTVTMQKNDGTAVTQTKYSAVPDKQGVLSSTAPLYWQDNVNQYGFHAVAGTETLEDDQSTQAKWLLQDRLEGYGYEPLLTGDDNSTAVDKLDAYNYRTSKEWYAANKDWKTQLSLVSDDECKRVPLFMQHKRSLVTVIVKAGDGVKREDVLAATASAKLDTHIYSYTAADDSDVPSSLEITPLQGEQTIHYDKDVNGEAADQVVARYDAVVMPYNYIQDSDDGDEQKICSINLGQQHFSFYASNDTRYADYKNLSAEEKLTSDFYQAYNLKEGDNLVITVTLSRESRKILMTAYVQPWTDVVTSYVCDDFGNSGDPIIINSQAELEAFLGDTEKNAPGNVAILNTSNITLSNWGQDYSLNAILNLGSHTLTLSDRLFKSITSSGSLINGTLLVKKGTDVATVVCQTNQGSVDRLTLENASETDRAVVTRAAVAEQNYGYITNITSRIMVEGKADGTGMTYIGGIAAISKNESGTQIPSITGCLVDARVGVADGQTQVRGGGIVGAANGYVTGNTFEYGITLLQVTTRQLKNIVYAKVDDNDLIATDNQWPTKSDNTLEGTAPPLTNARAEEYLYDQVVDCQEELKKLIEAHSTYNQKEYTYRLSDGFKVLSEDWTLGVKNDEQTNAYWGNVLFTLDGNGKTITLGGTKTIEYREASDGEVSGTYTTAPMLFCNIMGTVKNLTVNCEESLYGVPLYGDTGTSGNNMSQDICAPLAYSVIGGTVEDVTVHAVQKADGTYPKVVAAIPAGMVVWACNQAVIKNCICDMDVEMKVAERFVPSNDQRLYAGGMIAEAAKATVTQCQYVPRTNYEFKCYRGTSECTATDNIAFGGIIGGTVVKKYSTAQNSETPSVTISDCSSWYTFDSDKFTEGAVLGRAIYVSGTTNVSGVNKGACQGNWWSSGTQGVGEAGNIASGADEKTIGKRNSVTPDRPVLTD